MWHRLELKIPPPIILILCLFLGWWLAQLAIGSDLLLERWVPARQIVAGLLIAIGLSFDVFAAVQFHRAQTTINPLRPDRSRQLVQTGIYRFTRNPMYLGMSVVLCGGIIYWNNFLGFLVVPLFVIYLTRFQIKPEERILHAHFGLEFEQYAQRVRRWL